jgi:hypothetical protein
MPTDHNTKLIPTPEIAGRASTIRWWWPQSRPEPAEQTSGAAVAMAEPVRPPAPPSCAPGCHAACFSVAVGTRIAPGASIWHVVRDSRQIRRQTVEIDSRVSHNVAICTRPGSCLLSGSFEAGIAPAFRSGLRHRSPARHCLRAPGGSCSAGSGRPGRRPWAWSWPSPQAPHPDRPELRSRSDNLVTTNDCRLGSENPRGGLVQLPQGRWPTEATPAGQPAGESPETGQSPSSRPAGFAGATNRP